MGEFSVRIKCRAMEEDMRLNFNKKRKVYSKHENESCGEAELAEDSPSPAASRTSSCSKREDSNDVLKTSPSSPDLENADSHSEGFVTEISTSTGRVFSREATPTSELCGDSEHVSLQLSPPPTSRKKSTTLRRKTPNSAAESMPSAAELEAFFAAAEKYEQKRFSEKYNYDIVKDVPLEGKYHWVRLLP
ncbi:cyclin-dependent kinase inhibitor 7-like isoform X1 [Salvia splendens]|uniref:cyclin-dependent kinase inhibitor 7-like isoform X1 n=1 Tax=Salvia splendens TaxID=180675 RepID=UPI0011027D4E|nr:cyclin-dependent kinase inhibitor 7-like isoform X1 [Salvia splendens]